MTERKMAELAAKAVGLEIIQHLQDERDKAGYRDAGLYVREKSNKELYSTGWRPRTNAGESMDIAVKLRLSIEHNRRSDKRLWVKVIDDTGKTLAVKEFEREDQRLDWTLWAVLWAAARIGREM